MMGTSAVDKFEFLGPLARGVVGFSGLCAPVENVDPLGGFFTTVRFWTRETSVTGHDPTETSLTPAKFRSSLFLDALDRVERVLTSRRTVALDLTWHLYHGHHLNNLATIVGYLLLS